MDSNLFMALGRRVAAASALLVLAACATPAPPVQRAAKPPVAPKPAVAPELPPPGDSELASELILYLDEKMLETLRALAEAQKKSIAEVAREILSQALAGSGPWRAQLKEPD
ncbi:MAG TPA: ribbon-helix-helix domain-containing protein [Thermoanaerobaculia bacterium]|nr:ribbon-helix-helix domain-containing protein [Thermoanaerobaculia bacterium]